MLALKLEPEVESLLEVQAFKAGQSVAEFARRAILDRLEDREDYEAGLAAWNEAQGETAIPLAEVVKSLGLESEFSAKGTEAVAKPGRNLSKKNSEISARKTARSA